MREVVEEKSMKRSVVLLVVIIAIFAAAAGFVYWSQSHHPGATQRQDLRVLGYVGYDEPDFIQPLEKALNAHITVETYVGGDEMYSKMMNAPAGTYDVVVLDAEYGEKLFANKRILPLEPELWHFDDLFAKFQSGEPGNVGSAVYATVARWGALGIVYNKDRIDKSRLDTYAVLFDPSLKGHVGLYDWYLPNMGVLSLSLGNPKPYDIDETHLAQLEQELHRLRAQVTSIQPSPGQVLQDFRNGTTWIAPGVGEWAAAALASEGKPIDWAVPKPGGIMWVEAFSLAANSKHPDLAKQFLREVMRPQQLALLATRKAYFSQVTRRSAYTFIPAAARTNLKANDLTVLNETANQLHFRHLPGPKTTEQAWLAAWTRFKAGQ
jgi:spermidine/putrescine transport system substrate-binding protein